MRFLKHARVLIALVVLVLAAFVVAACGDDDNDSGGGSASTSGAETGAKQGGTIKIMGSSFPDFLDPGLSYTVDGWEALSQAYPGLLTYPHKPGQAGAEVVPALAKDLPEVSADGKQYKFQLRDGLKFSDGTPVKASDFKGSIERLLEMDSQGAGLGYTNIVGAEDFLKTKKGGVSGIKVDDATGSITIDLVKPRGAFSYELAIPFAGIVPAKTPAKNQTKNPPPGAGKYAIQDVEVNRSYKLVKNPNFSPSLKGTAVDAGNADGFDVTIERSLPNQATKISQNTADFMIDIPPADRLPEIKQKYANRFHDFATNSSFYFFMNSEVPPFNNAKARQAANYAVDVNAINRIQGGVLAPANTILPPGVPGHKNWPDLYPFDLDKAKQLVEESGTKGQSVTVWGNPETPTKPTVEYWADTLNKIGYKAKVKIVPAETYFTTIGDRSTKAQTGWANWFQDYPHPADFIDILLNPSKVVATGNNNYSYNAADKELAQEINALNNEPELTDEVKNKWAEVDRKIQEKAYWAIYGNRKQTTFMSDRMDFSKCKGEHSVYTHDWAEFCLK
jgi:peptide/nickel transport system substrate-binding protein